MTYKRYTDGTEKTELNEILTEENWVDLLDANDLSGLVAKMHTSKMEKLQQVDQRFNAVVDKLDKKGWGYYRILIGATGKDNVDLDASCILMRNKEKNLMYVAFHGSRNGSKNPFSKETGGDWGANHDKTLVNAKEYGLYGAPSDVMFHRGFGMNFVSVQDALLDEIKKYVESSDVPPHIIVSGHSKGGAEASIAIPVIKSYLKDNKLSSVKVSGVTISAPRTFNQAGAKWVRETVQERNIIRLKVSGDVATFYFRSKNGYEHVGVRLLDDVKKVNERSRMLNGGKKGSKTERWFANYHYAASRTGNGSYGFCSEVVTPHTELIEAYERGKASCIKKRDTRYYDGYLLADTIYTHSN